MEKKKILIVGGTGVISYAVVIQALNQGMDVTCINRGISKNQVLPSVVNIIKADYKNREIIEEKLQNLYFDVIVDVLCYNEADIEYSVSLFHNKCNQYVFFSSCAVYNKGNGDYECTEDSNLINPIWGYSINKVKCERKLLELSKEYNINYTIVRPAVTYGNSRIPYGITPPYGFHGTIIKRLLSHKPIIIWDNGETISTITHVDDFAVGLVGLFGNKKAYNQIFHIVGDHRYKWKEVLITMGEILNTTPVFFNMSKEQYAKEIPYRKGELLGGRGINQLLDNTKIKNAVPNFSSKITLKEGLTKTIEYYLSHNYLKGIDWKYDAEMDRIVKKWCKIKGEDSRNYNIGFIDYLGNATLSDKIEYWMEYHKECFFIKVIQCAFHRLKKFV